jgi:hypothetical protein
LLLNVAILARGLNTSAHRIVVIVAVAMGAGAEFF